MQFEGTKDGQPLNDMLATWTIWIANGNYYVVIPGPCFSPTRWRWIDQNDDSQADEREDNLYTYPDWQCSLHGCCDSVVVITPNR